MCRFFLPALLAVTWMFPLPCHSAEGEDAGGPRPLAGTIRPVSHLDKAIAAKAAVSDRSQRLPDRDVGYDPVVIDTVSAEMSASPLPPEPETIVTADRSLRPISASPSEKCAFAGSSAPCGDAGCSGCGGCDSCGPCRVHRDEKCCCRMPQHYPYFPPLHGYYYFRPYNHSHIPLHQQRAAGWGEDPRNPYANEIFRTVYENYQQERRQANQ